MGVLDRAIVANKPTRARILIVDIERRPMLSYHWSPKVDYIPPSMNVDKGGTFSFAAKWFGESKVTFMSDHHDGHDAMLAGLWQLMDEAHVVVGYNSVGFDCKHIATELVLAGHRPPSPHKDVDLLRAARSRFAFPYNSLNEVAKDLGIGRKVDTGGFDLWLACMAGDDKAWALMKRYNIADVRDLTEPLYCRLRPWIKNHPNVNLYTASEVSGCHVCGGSDLEPNGFKYASNRAYPTFHCNDCGSLSQSTHSEPSMTVYRKGA